MAKVEELRSRSKSKLAEMAEANQSGDGVMFGNQDDKEEK